MNKRIMAAIAGVVALSGPGIRLLVLGLDYDLLLDGSAV